ncbi:MAG: DCC1-like thiol-disulfide oxidoreductase family protein [Bacteroidota bacterium]|nr:DCC1-like thiol-disulfide oxidoreductase family protein [Bacteroidota bacterium]
MEKPDKPIIFIDGYCNLCNGLLRRILKLDKKNIFRFSSIQGETFRILMESGEVSPDVDSVVLYDQKRVFIKSEAVFEIARQLGGIHQSIRVFRVLPTSFNDAMYDLVARYRYRIFGRRKHCGIMPGKALKDKFLD